MREEKGREERTHAVRLLSGRERCQNGKVRCREDDSRSDAKADGDGNPDGLRRRLLEEGHEAETDAEDDPADDVLVTIVTEESDGDAGEDCERGDGAVERRKG